MNIFYNVVKRVNPADKNAEMKSYPVIRSIGTLTEREVAEAIADEVTLNPMEAEMTLYLLDKVMIRALLNGKTVKLGGLGTFYLTISSEGADSDEEVTAKLISKVNLRFRPSRAFREKLAKASFRPISSLGNNF